MQEPSASATPLVLVKAPLPPTPHPTYTLPKSLPHTALRSLSGLYASASNTSITSPSNPIWRSSLRESLRVQASTLRLIRFELKRTAASTTTPTTNRYSTLIKRHSSVPYHIHLLYTTLCHTLPHAPTRRLLPAHPLRTQKQGWQWRSAGVSPALREISQSPVRFAGAAHALGTGQPYWLEFHSPTKEHPRRGVAVSARPP